MLTVKKLKFIAQPGSLKNHSVIDIDKKVSNINDLVKITDYNTKITKIENKVQGSSGLVSKTNFSTKVS